jgi:hypothetical protein
MFRQSALICAFFLLASGARPAALDDVTVDVSQQPCEGFGAADKSYAVYATNLNDSQTIDANFKYDSAPAGEHFLLFDFNLNPSKDRFPKFHVRRLAPREVAAVGCTAAYRASLEANAPSTVPIVVTKQNAAYVGSHTPDLPAEDGQTFAAFSLRGGLDDCVQGARPPGMLYLVNLHPYARLSASFNLLDDRGHRISTIVADVAPLGGLRAGCSNGNLRPGPITEATLQISPGTASNLSVPRPSAETHAPPVEQPTAPHPAEASSALATLALGTIQQTQNVCAGSVPAGWIKINDAWNPTVCGNPASISYNVWIIQHFADLPVGAILHTCRGPIPPGWAIVGTGWNPTVCGHPAINQSNVVSIQRLN